MNQLPVSRVVNVGVNLAPLAAQAQSLSNLLLLGTSTVIDPVERYREYATIDAVAADFGTAAPEYLAALAWFAQRPQPTALIIGRWFQAAARGGLRCAPLPAASQLLATWNAIVNGSFSIQKDGAASVNVTAMNFSGATTMPGVAAIIQAGTGMPAGTTVTWNAVYSRFELASNTGGATSAISFLSAAGTGTDVSSLMAGRSTSSGAYVFQGQAVETAVAAVAAMDNLIGQEFYGLVVLGLVPGVGADNTQLLNVSAFIEASGNKHIHGITTQEGGAISAVSTTDLPYQLKQALYLRTITQYSSASPYAIMSALARILSVDYEGSNTAITLKFKQEPGVVAESLSTTQANAVRDKNCNVFVNYNNNTAILQEGVMASGEFCDTVTGTDWLAITTQRDVYNALYTSNTKIPQTDEGMGILKAVVEARCAQAVVNGLMAPGVWQSNGFGLLKTGDYLQKGYYVYSAPVSTQASANRAARMAVPIQVAVKLAGAIHSVNVTINVNN
jgi:hypothetical protein